MEDPHHGENYNNGWERYDDMALLVWTQTHTLKLLFLPYNARLPRYIHIGSDWD